MKRLILAFALFVCASAQAWNGTGHQVIAQIAWGELKPAVRDKVTALLVKHPHYAKHLTPAEVADAELPMRSFMLAATWADILRGSRDPKERAHHRGEWHYINLPIIAQGVDPVALKLPNLEMAWDESIKPGNIVQAMQWCASAIRNDKLDETERAVALTWLLHLAGDIHQPLHCCAYFDEARPAGDKGGNLFIVKYRGNVANLHGIWDRILGGYAAPKLVSQVTAKALELYPREKVAEELKVREFSKWAEEGLALAREVVYQGGKLKGFAGGENEAGEQVPELPQGYEEAARELARRRVVVGGYRLAELLNQVFAE